MFNLSLRPSAHALSAIAALAACPVYGQTVHNADGRAAESAADAFGIRIGVEQIGLYNESQVRGFNLQDAGNYRIGDAYFAKSGGIVDAVLAGVVTRVGYNALDADFAAPSGIVEYRLRSPFETAPVRVEAALREFGGRSLDLRLADSSIDGRLAGLIGAQVLLGKTSSGLSSNYYRFGSVTEWRPAEGTSISGIASLNFFDLQGFFGVSAAGKALPPRMKHPRRYVASWSDHDGTDLNLGLLGSTRLSETLHLKSSLIYSRLDLDRADFTQLIVDESGAGRAVGYSNRPRKNQSWSASLGGSWRPSEGHRLFAELRGRQSRNRFAPGVVVNLGAFDLEQGVARSPEPDLPPLPTTLDAIGQFSGGVGYEITGGRLHLKAGVQKTWHRREITAPASPREWATQRPWLYDASIAFAPGRDWTLFASVTRGLEETGAAPDNAANRNEVLPPTISKQRELGFRGSLAKGLTLIGSLFAIKKAAPGFDTNNVYGLFGQLRHRGAELSLVGNVSARLRVVSGAAILDAKRSGLPVATGAWSKEATGLPQFQAMTGLTYSLTGNEDLSFDGQINHSSSRRVSSRHDLRTPPLTTVDIGLRQGFDLGRTKVALRARITNLFNADSWVAARSELLDRPSRRAFRLILTANY